MTDLVEILDRGKLAKEFKEIKIDSGDPDLNDEISTIFVMFFSMPRMMNGELEVNHSFLARFKAFITHNTVQTSLIEKKFSFKVLTHLAEYSESFRSQLNVELHSFEFFKALTSTQLHIIFSTFGVTKTSLLKNVQHSASFYLDESLNTLMAGVFHSLSLIGSPETLESRIQIYRFISLLSQTESGKAFKGRLISKMRDNVKFYRGVVKMWHVKYHGINLEKMPAYSFESKVLKNGQEIFRHLLLSPLSSLNLNIF